MDKLFDSSWALRITALLLAFLLFFYVQSLQKDENTSSSSLETDILEGVPLEVYYDKDNLIVTGLPEKVDVKIEGPMQVVVQTKLAKDYKLFVDLNSLLIGEHSVPIQTENFSDKLKVTIEPSNIKVNIEERVSQEFKVEPEINSRLIADGFVLDSMEASPARVLITGAKSLVDNISFVKATVKSEGDIRESFSTQSNVVVLNRDLNKLDVSIEPQTVDVKVNIAPYKREIPLTLRTVGEADGVEINNLALVQKSILVTGPKSILDNLTELIVEIDLKTIKNNGQYEAKLQLPEGVSKASDQAISVEADVTVVPTTDSISEEDSTTID